MAVPGFVVDVCATGLCCRLQANGIGADLVFHSTFTHDTGFHHHLQWRCPDIDRWDAAAPFLPGGYDPVELLRYVFDQDIDNFHLERPYLRESLFPSIGGPVIRGDFESDTVCDPVCFVCDGVCVVLHTRCGHKARLAIDPLVDAGTVGIDGRVGVGDGDHRIRIDDQVPRFHIFDCVWCSVSDVCDADHLSDVSDPGEVAMVDRDQPDVGADRILSSMFFRWPDPLECIRDECRRNRRPPPLRNRPFHQSGNDVFG